MDSDKDADPAEPGPSLLKEHELGGPGESWGQKDISCVKHDEQRATGGNRRGLCS